MFKEEYKAYPIGLTAGFLIFAFLVFLAGVNPLSALDAMILSSFTSIYGLTEMLVRAIPLLLTALAFMIACKSGFYNIGGEGQLYIGALVATLAAFQLGNILGISSIALVLVCSCLGGIAWLSIPIIMKTRLGVNEIFTTVVLNFAAIYIVSWLVSGPLKDPESVNPQTRVIPSTTWLPKIIPGTRLHLGFLFAVLIAILFHYLLYSTALGHKIRAVGFKSETARYAGINVRKITIISAVLSGGLAGLAGGNLVLGTNHFLIDTISPGYAFMGIAIAAMASFRPTEILPTTILFATITLGGLRMESTVGLPYGLVYVLEAAIVISVIGIRELITRR